MRKSGLVTLMLAMLLCLVLVACTSKQPSTTATTPSITSPPPVSSVTLIQQATTTPTPKYGGKLKILCSGAFPPQIGAPSEITVQAVTYQWWAVPTFDRLFGRDLDFSPTPWLCESWEISQDKTSITMHLMKGVKFHDGTDFNAQAVKYNLDMQRTQNTSGKASLEYITSIDVINDNTLKLNLKQFSCALMPSNLASILGFIASSTAMQKKVSPDDMGQHMVGTGAFKFVDFKRDTYVKYTKWDGYRDPTKPYVDSIEILNFPDTTSKLMAFKAREGNFLSMVTPKDAPGLRAAGFKVFQLPTYWIWGPVPDSANADSPWSNLKVREAAGYAIDCKTISKDVWGEGYVPVYGQNAVPSDPFFLPGKTRAYDPAKAKQLLAEAGYAHGFKTTYWILPSQKDYATAIQGYLQAVGIDMEVQVVDQAKQADLINKGWHNGLMHASTLVGLGGIITAFSEYPLTTNLRSMTRPAGWQAVVDAAAGEPNDNARLERYKQINSIMFDQAMFLPIYANYELDAYAPELNGIAETYGKFSTWWEPWNAWVSK
jgi:peptide/nickel transport system substrate-binding protein